MTLRIAQPVEQLCHEAVTQFEDSRVEVLEHESAVRKGFNLAATSALGHVTVTLASAAPELDSTLINKLTEPMTSDQWFSTAQSVCVWQTDVIVLTHRGDHLLFVCSLCDSARTRS